MYLDTMTRMFIMMTDSAILRWKGWNIDIYCRLCTFLSNQICHGPLITTILQGNLKICVTVLFSLFDQFGQN